MYQRSSLRTTNGQVRLRNNSLLIGHGDTFNHNHCLTTETLMRYEMHTMSIIWTQVVDMTWCGSLNKDVLHERRCSNTWPPVDSVVLDMLSIYCLVGGSMVIEVILEVSKPLYSQCTFCFLYVVGDVNTQVFPPPARWIQMLYN